jgi:ribonucleoside-diphosphate reductase alpha chain
LHQIFTLKLQYLAARLAIFHLRKKSFKSFTPPPLFEHVRKFTALGIYDKDILDKYSKQEIEELDAYTMGVGKDILKLETAS